MADLTFQQRYWKPGGRVALYGPATTDPSPWLFLFLPDTTEPPASLTLPKSWERTGCYVFVDGPVPDPSALAAELTVNVFDEVPDAPM